MICVIYHIFPGRNLYVTGPAQHVMHGRSIKDLEYLYCGMSDVCKSIPVGRSKSPHLVRIMIYIIY